MKVIEKDEDSILYDHEDDMIIKSLIEIKNSLQQIHKL